MIYIYDSSTATLIITQLSGGAIAEETEVEIIARDHGMSSTNLDWANVRNLELGLTDFDASHPDFDGEEAVKHYERHTLSKSDHASD